MPSQLEILDRFCDDAVKFHEEALKSRRVTALGVLSTSAFATGAALAAEAHNYGWATVLAGAAAGMLAGSVGSALRSVHEGQTAAALTSVVSEFQLENPELAEQLRMQA